MATRLLSSPSSCTPYTAEPPAPTEPPELDYKFFTPEFLDELEEHYQAMAVGQLAA